VTQTNSSPTISGVLETSLYVDDLDRSALFYEKLFGFKRLVSDDRLCALSVQGRQVLLLFKKGASKRAGETPGGTIPAHDGSGSLHMAFAIPSEDLIPWEKRLTANHVVIESRVHWQEGGMSLYFRDPDNHSIELAAPGTWTIY